MQTIICIPGLGGRANLFDKYQTILSGFKLEHVDLIDWQKTEQEIYSLVEKNEKVIFFCSCYGGQMALRAIRRYPEKVTHLIVVEPFFAEQLSWVKLALAIDLFILAIIKVAHGLGIKRKKFPEVDYNFVEKQPLFIQPYYDIKHQGSRFYFEKIRDIITYRLPVEIKTKTFFIFSPSGFVRHPKKRAFLKKVFINLDVAELGGNTHNIMTLSSFEIGEAVKNWLNKSA